MGHDPFGGLFNGSFTGVAQDYKEKMDIFIMLNSSKIMVIKYSNEYNFMAAGHHSVRNCIKGLQEGWEALL